MVYTIMYICSSVNCHSTLYTNCDAMNSRLRKEVSPHEDRYKGYQMVHVVAVVSKSVRLSLPREGRGGEGRGGEGRNTSN